MVREFFLTAKRIGFSEWKSEDGKYELGFQYIGNEFYEPTGLYHPSYERKSAI